MPVRRKQRVERGERVGMAAHRPRSVLLVHPHQDSREMYAELLRHSGLSVSSFAEAERALPLAPHADVIVTGIRLAGAVDGIELIGRLRSDRRTVDTLPAISLSARARGVTVARAYPINCSEKFGRCYRGNARKVKVEFHRRLTLQPSDGAQRWPAPS